MMSRLGGCTTLWALMGLGVTILFAGQTVSGGPSFEWEGVSVMEVETLDKFLTGAGYERRGTPLTVEQVRVKYLKTDKKGLIKSVKLNALEGRILTLLISMSYAAERKSVEARLLEAIGKLPKSQCTLGQVGEASNCRFTDLAATVTGDISVHGGYPISQGSQDKLPVTVRIRLKQR